MTMLSLITGKMAPYLMAGVAALVALFGAYFKGRRDSHAARDAKDAKAYKTTTERMQDAEAAFGDDPAVLRERMRDRNTNQR